MKSPTICRHCGRWRCDHEHFHLPYEEAETILPGYELSIVDCLQGFGFEPKDIPSPNQD